MYIQGKYLLGGLNDISECLKIRGEVFGKEQGFPTAAGADEDDSSAIFALAYETEKTELPDGTIEDKLIPVGTGRLIFADDFYKIGRIAVKKEYRGKKYGDFIVRMLVDKAFVMGAKEVFVGAQKAAIPFYEKIGFVELPEEYYEDEIYHKMMKIMPTTCKRDCGKH